MAVMVACGPDAAPTDPPAATSQPPTAVPTATLPVAPPIAAPVQSTSTRAPTPTVEATTAPTPTSTPLPEGGPQAPLPTEVPLPQSVEITPDDPVAPLAMLPSGSLIYTHINLETVWQRPDLREHVAFQLGHFVSESELPIAEELLATLEFRTLTLSIPAEGYEWAGILQGEVSMLGTALAMASESGMGLSISVIESYRGTDIYSVLRIRSSGRQSEVYLSVLDDETLAASPDLPALRDVIDRSRGTLEVPHALSAMIGEWGLGDFLQVLNARFFGIGATLQGTPLDRQRVYGFHATLSGDSTTILRAVQQYDSEELAAAAAGWLQEQLEPRWRNIGWRESATIGQWQYSGATVYGEVTVPDRDVPGLVLGN